MRPKGERRRWLHPLQPGRLPLMPEGTHEAPPRIDQPAPLRQAGQPPLAPDEDTLSSCSSL
jgi:hypothetical protein